MVKIITDSSADLPQEVLQQYDITVVPLTVLVDGKEFQEGIDLTPLDFYEKMKASQELPKTSMPSPQSFAAVFRNFVQLGDVLCLTISSNLSGTYRSACLSSEEYDGKVAIFDTLSGSLGHGISVLKAAELAAQGIAMEEILKALELWRKKMNIFILLDTLENVVKGGRLSWVQGSLSKLLNVKVLLEGVDGSITVLEKVRGKKRVLKRVLDLIAERRDDFSDAIFGVTHVDCPEDLLYITQEIESRFHPKRILVNYMGSTMATYAGNGGIIISYI